MYDACINYPGRISAWPEDMVNKVIEDIRANGTSETCSFSELSDRDLEFVVEAVMESSLDDVKSRLMETCGIAME
jgi:hypothetical protein